MDRLPCLLHLMTSDGCTHNRRSGEGVTGGDAGKHESRFSPPSPRLVISIFNGRCSLRVDDGKTSERGDGKKSARGAKKNSRRASQSIISASL